MHLNAILTLVESSAQVIPKLLRHANWLERILKYMYGFVVALYSLFGQNTYSTYRIRTTHSPVLIAKVRVVAPDVLSRQVSMKTDPGAEHVTLDLRHDDTVLNLAVDTGQIWIEAWSSAAFRHRLIPRQTAAFSRAACEDLHLVALVAW